MRVSAALAALVFVVAGLGWPAGADTSTPRPGGTGEWQVAPDGAVTATGGAGWFGDARGLDLWEPVVSIVSTPTGRGYWLVARDSGVFAYGDASYQGNLIDALVARDDLPPGVLNGSNVLDHLEGEIVDAVAAPEGDGYWLLGADGGVFDFGSASFEGSVSGRLPAGWVPLATDISPTPDGYRIQVFLYEPAATADADGVVSGITQSYACRASACTFEGQRLGTAVVPGVERAPAACAHAVRQVGPVVDGDTLALDGVSSRLYDLDTPERGEAGFDRATADLAAFLGTATTCVEFHYCDVYDRPVVTIHHGGTTTSRHMQSLGWPPYAGSKSGAGSWPCTSATPPAPAPPPPSPPPLDQACDPNYSPCVPAFPPDLDCADIGRRVSVVGPSDPHRLDGDGDGWGCDSYG